MNCRLYPSHSPAYQDETLAFPVKLAPFSNGDTNLREIYPLLPTNISVLPANVKKNKEMNEHYLCGGVYIVAGVL